MYSCGVLEIWINSQSILAHCTCNTPRVLSLRKHGFVQTWASPKFHGLSGLSDYRIYSIQMRLWGSISSLRLRSHCVNADAMCHASAKSPEWMSWNDVLACWGFMSKKCTVFGFRTSLKNPKSQKAEGPCRHADEWVQMHYHLLITIIILYHTIWRILLVVIVFVDCQ